MNLYPMGVNLEGRVCLVVGGGKVAERKIAALRKHGALIRLVSPEATAALQALAQSGEIEWIQAWYAAGLLDGVFLVMACTDDRVVNAQVTRDAQAQRLLALCADDPDAGNFVSAASVTRGDLVLTVSTGGGSPTLASVLRERLENEFGPEWGPLVKIIGAMREIIKTNLDEAGRKAAIGRILDDPEVHRLLLVGESLEAEARNSRMSLLVLGINHTSAPIEVREKLAFLERDLPRALTALSALPHVREGALLSTCNRTEAYAVTAPDAGPLENALAEFLAGWHGLSRHEFDGHLYCYRAGAAANHLFSVSSGLDSMILGEPDIQRQVKTALEAAQSANSLGARLNRLFQDALVTGKRTRTETGIARGTFSVGAAAVELATQIFGESLAGHTVLVLGAGKMSEVTARHLQARGAPAVLVANRTYEKAVALAAQFGGAARRFDDLSALLASADIVVCSTAAPHPIVSRTLMQSVMRSRRGRPLYLIDIAVPRDVEASVDSLENVHLYNIDHLQSLVAGARHTRAGEVTRAREIVEASTAEYLRWERSLDVAPLIVAVRQKLDVARSAELERLRSRLPDLPEKDWQAIEASFAALTNKIAHPATVAIKSAPEAEDGAAALDAIRRAFGVRDPSPTPPPEGEGLSDTHFAPSPLGRGLGVGSSEASE